MLNSPKSSFDTIGSPLVLSDLRSPSPSTNPVMPSQQQLFIKMEEQKNKIAKRDFSKGFHKRLSASDIYNCELSDISQDRNDYKSNQKFSPELKKDVNYTDRMGSLSSELRLSNLKCATESSFSSSLTSTGSYFDSINTDNNVDDERLMHVEVAFEWNPVPMEEIRYLPPAAHMWNLDHTLTPDKRLPPVRSPLCNGSACWIPAAKQPTIFGHQPMFSTENCKINSSGINNLQNKKFVYPVDSLEGDHNQHHFEAMGKMRNKLRSVNGAVRVKNVDRPSVLSLVQGGSAEANKSLSNSKDSLYSNRSQSSSPKTSSIDQMCNNIYGTT